MEIKAITFEEPGRPATVTAELTQHELLYLGLLLGSRSPADAEQVMTGGARIQSDLYRDISGYVFNPFYEDGIEEAAASR